MVAFVGITIYRDFFGKAAARASRPAAVRIAEAGETAVSEGSPSTGAGAKPELIHGARVFVLPNPSGLNASFPGFKHKLVWFERLREFIDSGPGASSRI